MLGKAFGEAVCCGRKPDFEEADVELMSDGELLLALRSSRRQLCRRLVDKLLRRHLFKPAFRARALRETEITMRSYEARKSQFQEKQLFHPQGRIQAEATLASNVARRSNSLKASDVIIYITAQAPGLQKVTQYIEKEQGKTVRLDEVHDPYQNIVTRHLKLWTVYVFAPPDLEPRVFNELGSVAEIYFGLPNEINLNRRRGVLF
jgi:HD superfamily phosphohydrolase